MLTGSYALRRPRFGGVSALSALPFDGFRELYERDAEPVDDPLDLPPPRVGLRLLDPAERSSCYARLVPQPFLGLPVFFAQASQNSPESGIGVFGLSGHRVGNTRMPWVV